MKQIATLFLKLSAQKDNTELCKDSNKIQSYTLFAKGKTIPQFHQRVNDLISLGFNHFFLNLQVNDYSLLLPAVHVSTPANVQPYLRPCCLMYLYFQTHNEVNDHHQILSVTEYLKSSYAREVRFCDKHKEQVLSLACSKCYLIRCARCLKSGEGCPEGWSTLC